MPLTDQQILLYKIEELVALIDKMQPWLGSKRVNEAYAVLIDLKIDAERSYEKARQAARVDVEGYRFCRFSYNDMVVQSQHWSVK